MNEVKRCETCGSDTNVFPVEFSDGYHNVCLNCIERVFGPDVELEISLSPVNKDNFKKEMEEN